MSKYTRGYDITNRNSADITSKGYDSPRFSDRGKLNLDKFDSEVTSTPFEFGVSYKSPRTHDTSTKSHDITSKSYDRNTQIDDVTKRSSPARHTSLSDRDVVSRQAHHHVEPPIDRRRQQRHGSNDSSGSHSSDRLAPTEERSVLGALKHRYQENAEKSYDDPGTRAPFSSWRRSGNFEEVTSSIAPEAHKEKTKSLERKTFHNGSDRTYRKYDASHDERSRGSSEDADRSRSGVQGSFGVSEKQADSSADDLVYNFRQALCRHALSETEKSQEHDKGLETSAPSSNIEDDATSQRLERLRVARAKIHEQRNPEKVSSMSFATEFKLDKDKTDKSRTVSSSVPVEKDKQPAEDINKLEEFKHRQSTKLARQKLVSDDLKAKYMIKREDEKEPPAGETSAAGNLERKRSDRKQRLKEHTEIWSKDKESVAEKKNVPSMEDMLLGSTEQTTTKTSSVAKKFQNVDHSSPFGSVYSRPSSVIVTTTSPSLSSSSATAITTTASSSTTHVTSTDKKDTEKLKNEIPVVGTEESVPLQDYKRPKSKSDRKYKKYDQKSKSLELGLLSEGAKQDQEKKMDSKDDIVLGQQEDSEQQSRQERIAKYKEERRKQLKTIQDKFAAGEMPSLFLSSKGDTDSSVSRSHSLKVETENRYGSSVSRSKSLKEESEKESDYSGRASPMRDAPKMTTGLRLAEIGNQEKVATGGHSERTARESTKKSDADKIIDKLHALKKLTKEQLQKSHLESSGSHEEDSVEIVQPGSYTSRVLLADRVMDEPAHVSPARDRVRSSSRETDGGRSDKVERSKHKFRQEPEQQKNYFEFGTVFAKPKPETGKPVERSSSLEKSMPAEQVGGGTESSARIRRKLPSIEDVLGTNEDEPEKSPKNVNVPEKKMHAVENVPDFKYETQLEDISDLKAEEINSRKIAGNIRRAKNKFKEDDKKAGAFEASKFELGTVYAPKKEEKQRSIPEPVCEPASLESSRSWQRRTDTVPVDQPQYRPVSWQPPEKSVARVVEKPVRITESHFDSLLEQTSVKPQYEPGVPQEIKSQQAGSSTVYSPTVIQTELQSKPPSSPRQERKKRAEQKFGKVSHRANEPFEFGTSYTKKETVDEVATSKVPERHETIQTVRKEEVPYPFRMQSPDLAPETMKETKKVFDRDTKPARGVEQSGTILQPFGYTPPKSETSVKHDTTTQAVSRASGQRMEVPSSAQSVPPARTVKSATTRQDISVPQPMSPVRVASASASVRDSARQEIPVPQSVSPQQTISTATTIKESRRQESSVPTPMSPVRAVSTASVVKKSTGQEIPVPQPLSPVRAVSKAITVREETSVPQPLSPVRAISTVSTARDSTRQVSVPQPSSSIYGVSPVSSLRDSNRQESSSSQQMKVDILPTKTQADMFTFEQIKEEKHVMKPVETVQRIPSFEAKADKPVLGKTEEKPVPEKKPEKPVPERQTSFTKLELKSPSDTKPKVETREVAQTVSAQPQKAEVPSPAAAKEEKQLPSSPSQPVEASTPTRVDRQISSGSAIDSTEIKTAFDVHKKLVEEKIEEQSKKRSSANIEEWPIDKLDKKCDLFEQHKKQIEMKLETPQEPTHIEKTIEKQDSEVFEMHKKQIQEKLELKYQSIADKTDDNDVVMDERLESKEEKVRMEIEKMRKIEAEKQRRLELAAKQQEREERREKLEAARAEAPRVPEQLKKDVAPKTQEKMNKALMETSLDDILSKNVDYLSDMEAVQMKNGKKKRPQSVHEHQKPKRSLKKKSGYKRSKSEELSLLGSGDGAIGHEDYQGAEARYSQSRNDQEGGTTGSSQDTYSGSESVTDSSKYSSEYESSNSRLVSATDEEIKEIKPAYTEISKSGSQLKNFTSLQKSESDEKWIEAEDQSVETSSIMEKVSFTEISKNEDIHIENLDKGPQKLDNISGMTSDASDVSDRKQFVRRDGESARLVSDSDQSISSNLSEGSRKRRKDKSSLRKSKLNESTDDASSVGRRRDSSDDSSQTSSRVGVRRVSSSRLARESREDKYKGSELEQVHDVLKNHDIEIPLTKRGTSLHPSNGNQSNKLPVNTDHKHANNIDSPRNVNRSILDSQPVLPSRFALPSKVSAAISRLTESSERESSPQTKTDEQQTPRRIRRVNNFSELLQKFSGSDASSSEKSDSESPRRNKTFLKRQEACLVSSGSGSDTRKTPERTQSLKIKNTESETMDRGRESVSSVQRSSSFKSDFMKRRFSPEPVERRRLPFTPAEQSDKPSPELAKVLNKRSEIVAKQQEVGEDIERKRIHDGKVEKADRFSAAGNDDVIADSEVLQMLRSRRKETDSSVEQPSVPETETKSQTETVSALKLPAESVKSSQSYKISVVNDSNKGNVQSQTPSKISVASSKSSETVIEKSETKSVSAKPKTDVPPKLDLNAIDTSLSVLKTVTNDLDNKDNTGDRLKADLSHLKVTSPTQVASFIKSVENESHRTFEKSQSASQPFVAKSKVMEPNVSKVMESRIESAVQSAVETVPKSQSQTSSSHSGTVDITNKSEIMRKISTRDRTPERQSPKRSGPIKVMGQLQTETGPTLTRTESVGRSDSERPKGILKRTPSLKQTGVIVDPELAEVLKSRRRQQEDMEEEEESRKMTAEEEIRQAREEAQTSEKQDDGERELSVAERIFQMHNKIEEVKSCPITPKAYSGFTTPKSALQRSGNITPRSRFSFDEGTKESGLSGSQLIERLTSLEGRQSSLSEKRQKFVNRRRDDARTRTQPVTLLEIQAADSLETVKNFRAEVIKKASINVFEALQKEEKKGPFKKTEYPQPIRVDRRPRNQRHKTLPVTAEELKAIPEGEAIGTMNSLKKKFDIHGARDSKADSGILSGSDGDFVGQDADETIGEDDPVKLSVSAKASMFLQIQESLKERQDKKSASGAKRYIDRKKRERSRTLPITEDEVKLAAEIADKEEEENTRSETTQKEASEALPVVAETTKTKENTDSEDTDELSRQSLRDKVKLFTSIEEEKKVAAQKKGVPPPPRRKNRKLASRFATQPVTYEEVEKAAKISPLACSLVKPPDPEVLSGLSVKAQRELMTQHAQQALSQPSSRAGSRAPSRATSISDLSGEVINQDSLTIANTDTNASYTAIETSSETVRPSEVRSKGFEVKRTEEKHSSQTVEKVQVSNLDSTKKNILKSQLEEKLSLLHGGPKGKLRPDSGIFPTVSDINKVLRKESSMEASEQTMFSETTLEMTTTSEVETRSGMKMTSAMMSEMKTKLSGVKISSETTTPEVKGILKKEGSFETSKLESEVKSAIKGSELKSDSVAETESDDNLLEGGTYSSGDNLDSDEGVLDEKATGNIETKGKQRDHKARRRFNREKRLEQERYKTQPAEVSAEAGDSSRAKKKYVGRHLTQPVTPDEKKEAEIATDIPAVSKSGSGSINDRLNALKKSGEEDWRKRVSRPLDLDKLDRRSASPEFTPPTSGVKMREKSGLDMPRPSSIADRMSLLGSAQEGWRDRVGETDVKKFTIEHKISSSGQTIGESPLVARLRGKTPRKENSRDSESSESSDLISPSSPTKPQPKEVVCHDLPADLSVDDSKSPLSTIDSVEEEKGGTTVSVPQMGAELEGFFKTKKAEVTLQSPELEVSVDDFNELFLNANDMLETQRRIKPKRRFNTKSRNPLKTMSASLEVKSEYTEVIHGVAEREMKNIKVAALQQNSGFAVEALAGLASKENFAKVELRKTDSDTGSPSTNTRLEPYLPLMLIHIKGRRKVQCRLVEPKADSINSGDCYVLVTPDRIINWVGDYCNVIEKSKAADVCDFVKQKRDLGCKRAREVMIVEEKKGNLGNARHFWDLLGGYKPYMASGPAEEDELYETHIVETNMIYKLDNNKLVPVSEYWGNQPKYEMLQSSQVYVFDFGSELYLWQGKTVSPNMRKISVKLAQQLWNQGYDYSQCDVNPISPLRTEEEGGYPGKSDKRPEWALFGKVNQNMETILFREKFADWPDTSRLIKVKSQDDVSVKVDLADLKPYDAKLMVPVDTNPVSMVLEGSHVGRGTKWEQDMEGFVKEQEIQTLKIRVWHVLEYEHYEIEDHSYGQFHEGDTYVVKWQFMIVNAGMKSLKGSASKFSQLGRERCAYFFWQGKSSTINEKGASALMTVELDEERGPQVRVLEGKEPPCFLNLFKGRMIIHIGKREEEETNTQGPWRFYCLRNEYENEMCLIEVPKDISNLRSVSSSLLLNVVTGNLTVWHGCKSPQHTKKLAKKAAENLKEECPLEVGLLDGVDIVINEIEEGKERTDFWRAMNVLKDDRSKYNCLLKNPKSFNHTLRLFHMTSVSGVFEAHEILNPSRTPELPTMFPVLQADLYSAQQPALFLVDNGHEIYLWQGWWPEGDEDQENVLTGSAQTRFAVDRRCAMETTLHYCKEINPKSPPPAYMVYAGLEPLSFTNLFPFWTVDDTARELNLRLAIEQDSAIRIIHQDGKTEGELVPVQDLLNKLTKTRYTFAELLETPLPEGVDPLKLESYLSDTEFEAVLEMTRDEFYALPAWKQQKLKQAVSLF